MDRLGEQDAAQFGVETPAPGRRVVGGRALPGGFDRRQIGCSGKTEVDDAPGPLHAVAEAVLEDRHQPPDCGAFGRNELIDLGERARDRLFADDVFAGGERR
jgi:hypothetical protein